jgi:hypothetical protein
MISVCFVVRNEDIEVCGVFFHDFKYKKKNRLKSRFLRFMNLYLDFLIMESTIDDWKRRQVSDVAIANFFLKKNN